MWLLSLAENLFLKDENLSPFDGIPVMNHRLIHGLRQIARNSRNTEKLQSLAPSNVEQMSDEWLGLEGSSLAKFVSSFRKPVQLKSSPCLTLFGVYAIVLLLTFNVEAWFQWLTHLIACALLPNCIPTTPVSRCEF